MLYWFWNFFVTLWNQQHYANAMLNQLTCRLKVLDWFHKTTCGPHISLNQYRCNLHLASKCNKTMGISGSGFNMWFSTWLYVWIGTDAFIQRGCTWVYIEGLSTFWTFLSIRKEAFMPERGARAGVKKVMVIVTDGESHDSFNLDKVMGDCDDDGIERFGIAVSTNHRDIKLKHFIVLVNKPVNQQNCIFRQIQSLWQVTPPWKQIRLLCFQVLGDYNRQNKSAEEVQKFIKEIESITSQPTQDHFFNVSDEVALLTIVDALGSKIFALEGDRKHTEPFQTFKTNTYLSPHTTDIFLLVQHFGKSDYSHIHWGLTTLICQEVVAGQNSPWFCTEFNLWTVEV